MTTGITVAMATEETGTMMTEIIEETIQGIDHCIMDGESLRSRGGVFVLVYYGLLILLSSIDCNESFSIKQLESWRRRFFRKGRNNDT